jgi:DNA-directed RNA polymerase subunit RPC12/RpoP
MMQGWSAAPPSRPQSYSVACAEGHRLHGQRTEGYQALRCPTCGEGIFVLPRSPLPEPPAPASPSPSRVAAAFEAFPEDDPLVLTDPPPSMGAVTQADLDEPEAEIDWVDEVPTEPEAKPVVVSEAPVEPPRPRSPRPSPKVGRPTGQPKAPEPAIAVAIRPTLREWASAHRNALLVAGVVLLIVGAVGMRRHRQRLEDLPRIAEIGRAEGLKRLDSGEFHAAKKLLADADDAVKGLGGRYEGADAIHQGALEAAIFADLAPAGIDEILEEAATSDPAKWPSRFAAMYKGRSVIIDPPVLEVPNPAKPGSSYTVNYPLYFGRGPRPEGRGRIDLAGFRLFELSQPKLDEQKPFGARYASIELDLTTNEWVVTFEPESGVYITHTKALESINWSPSEAAEEPGP